MKRVGTRILSAFCAMVIMLSAGNTVFADMEIYNGFRGQGNNYGDSWQMSTPTPPPLQIPSKPLSPYGQALRKNLIYGEKYSEHDKADVVTYTYYNRKDGYGNRMSWYTSADYDDENTGYRIGLYNADGLLFFAEAYVKGKAPDVTFYFWGDQMIACHDFRVRNHKLSFPGSETYERVVREFGDIYLQAYLHCG